MFMLKLQRTINKLELESKSSEPGGKKKESKTINLRKSFLGYERLVLYQNKFPMVPTNTTRAFLDSNSH